MRGVPTRTRRLALGIGALAATLMLAGAGAGVAVADPDDPANPPDTGQTSEPTAPSEPTPAPSATPEVKGPLNQLRDLLRGPRSIFGNGRLPGQPPPTVEAKTPGAEEPEVVLLPGEGSGEPTPDAPPPGDVVPVESEPKPEPPVDTGLPVDPQPRTPTGHTAEVTLPWSKPFTIPLPTLPGTMATRFSINLSDPLTAYSSVAESVGTFNSMVTTAISDALAPYNPFPPKPPSPTLRTMEEEPVTDASGGIVSGGGGGGVPVTDVMPNVPVLQAPVVIPVPRIGPPRPVAARTAPAGAAPRVLASGSAGARTTEVTGSVAPTGTVQAGRLPSAGSTSALGAPAYRQGFPQYLRAARVGELAMVAVPGIAGLLVLTASGGVIGYRQADSTRFVRVDAARFLQ